MVARKHLIQKGSIVRIMEPVFFLRTRYEKEFRDFLNESFAGDEKLVNEMMMPFTVHNPFNYDKAEANLRDHIHRGLASYRLEKCKADGNRKILETINIYRYAKWKFYAYDTKIAVTGDYETSSSYTDHEGHTDYTYPKLINKKHHRILMVVEYDFVPEGVEPQKMMIEDIHCKFVEKKTIDSVPLPYVPIPEDSSDMADRYWEEEHLRYLNDPNEIDPS